MTVRGLMEELDRLTNDGHGDAEVRMAYQPHYPLYESVGEVGVPEAPHFFHLTPGHPLVEDTDLSPGWYVTSDTFPDDGEEPLNGIDPLPDEEACIRWTEDNHARYIYLGGGYDNGYLDSEGRRQLGW